VTRLLRPPRPIRVRLGADGAPCAVEMEGRLVPVETLERWRTSEAWWADPVDREYARVAGPEMLFVIFCDLLGGGWFLERVLD